MNAADDAPTRAEIERLRKRAEQEYFRLSNDLHPDAWRRHWTLFRWWTVKADALAATLKEGQ